MKAFQTCVEVLRYIEENHSNPTALNKRENEAWQSTSTAEFVAMVKEIALGLNQLGMKRGDRVGIMAHPSPLWTIVDFAIVIAGGIAVPLFATISDENFVHEITETNLKILFVEGEEQWQMIERHVDLFDSVIALDQYSLAKSIPLQELINKGKQLREQRPSFYRELEDAVHPDDLAAIIYTSGSTGKPKGVELTQKNLVGLVSINPFHWHAYEDSYLSVLPLAHVLGHCVNFWMVAWGASIYYSNDYKRLGEICREVKPTATVVVPRLLEKIYMKMQDTVMHLRGPAKLIGKLAFAMAEREKPSFFSTLLHPLLDHLVYSKLREGLGGKLRVVLTGGASLNPHLDYFFSNIGIPIYEGWGLTEACPLCVNLPNKKKVGTVGPILPGHEVKISPEGEVLVKGPLVMRGYYRNPEATAITLDSEGWLHTGDRGNIDPEGFLTIYGRIKDLYKTSTGEYVAPIPIEQAFSSYPLIEMAMVVAEGRKFTSCLFFPNREVLAQLKSNQKASHLSDEEFLKSPFIRQEIDRLLSQINKQLNHWEQIHDYRFVLEPLTIQGGELTPSMKIRRQVVTKKYSDLIDQMYPKEVE